MQPRLDAVDQARQRPRLRLGGRARTAIGLVGRIRRGALVVVAPVRVEVAVRVDAVADGDLPVAVVVAEVLPPQPVVVERVLVAVGIRDDDEPQLAVFEDPPDLLVLRVPAVDEVVQEPAVDLRADPLARVLRRRVQDGRARAVAPVTSALRDLQGDDLAALMRPPQDLELHDLAVVLRDRVELVADAAGLVPGAEDAEAAGRLQCGLLRDRLALLVPRQPDPHAARGDLGTLRARQHRVCPDARGRLADAGELGAAGGLVHPVGAALQGVHLELLPALAGSGRSEREGGRQHGQPKHGTASAPHGEAPLRAADRHARPPKASRGARSPHQAERSIPGSSRLPCPEPCA